MADLFLPIISLIIANFGTDYPPKILTPTPADYPIYQGNQNNWVAPNNGKYVVITELDDDNLILNPRSVPNLVALTQKFITVISTTFQIDFYGNNSKDNSKIFQLLLNSTYANDFFVEHGYLCSVNKVERVRNLTALTGRSMYLPRYTLRYSLISNIVKTTPLNTYDGFENKTYVITP